LIGLFIDAFLHSQSFKQFSKIKQSTKGVAKSKQKCISITQLFKAVQKADKNLP